MSVPFFCTSPVGAPVDMFEAGKDGLPVFAVVIAGILLNVEASVCESVDELCSEFADDIGGEIEFVSDKTVVVVGVVIVCCTILIVVANDGNNGLAVFNVVEFFVAFKKVLPPLTTVRALLLANVFPFENAVIVLIPPFVVELESVNWEAGWPSTQLFIW